MTRNERNDPNALPAGSRAYRKLPMHSHGAGRTEETREFRGKDWRIPRNRHWTHTLDGFRRLSEASRINPDITALSAIYYHDDYKAAEISNSWQDTGPEIVKSYVVQTAITPVERCILMTTDPGDLVLDPTCGSGTTALRRRAMGPPLDHN